MLNDSQTEAIEQADAYLNNAVLPTYSQMTTALNELAAYVRHGASPEAIAASAARAIQIVNQACHGA
jgi:hypothetical protein